MFLSRILPYPRIALTAVAILLASCAGAPSGNGSPDRKATWGQSTGSLRSGFACCNLRYSGDQLSSSNYAQLPFIAVGTPVLIRTVSGVVNSCSREGTVAGAVAIMVSSMGYTQKSFILAI